MRSVKQNLRLNNRRESGRLTFFCKRRETRRVFAQAFLCRKSIANPDYRPPFCEFRSEFYVFLKPRRKSIKPIGHLFLWRTGQWLVLNLVERLCLLVNFDAGKNAASFQFHICQPAWRKLSRSHQRLKSLCRARGVFSLCRVVPRACKNYNTCPP